MNDSERLLGWWGRRGIVYLCFVLLFLYFLKPVTGADVPWHIASGQYIIDTGVIPHEDPFSYAGDEIPFIGKFILSQYWLAQVVLAVTNKYLGLEGIVVGRAVVMTVIIVLLWNLLGRKNILFSLVFLGGYASYFLKMFSEARPQLFTLLFVTVLFWLIEKYREKGLRMYLYPVPLLMLVWSNMHGGYIFGVLLLVLYLFTHFLRFLLPSVAKWFETPEEKSFFFLVIGLLSILLSCCNPNGFNAFFYALTTQSKGMFTNILEYSTPFQLGNPVLERLLLVYWAAMPVVLALLVLSIRSRALFASALLLLTVIMTFSAIRYIPFLVICTVVTFRYVPLSIQKIFPETANVKGDLVLSLFILLAVGLVFKQMPHKIFQFDQSIFYSTEVVQFLKKNKLFGNIFASYNKSAFIHFGLYPNAKIYFDNRFISPDRINRARHIQLAVPKPLFPALVNRLVDEQYRTISPSDPLLLQEREERKKWRKRLDESGTEIIVHEALQVFSGEFYTFLLALLDEPDWKLVYLDGRVVVLLKDIPKFRTVIERNELDKKYFYAEMMHEAERGINNYGYKKFYSAMALGTILIGNNDSQVPFFIQRMLAQNSKSVESDVARSLYLKMRSQGMWNVEQ